ncbi:uncharacterized protein LOC132750716 isoform X2 [Ruditapes philippinarum]|uniref:uncharacterized protein LOC132750716 isoform X2 n=1 Tax=Ruditapes philippinarum TaxID=129788 RepID=UPI00295AD2DF|nr:uncharacterized protein LOC132750716 isoform X2 [Ruditapes philippinarum]
MAYRNQTAAFMLDIEIKSKDLQIDKSTNGLLGRGGYGSVYMGKYKGTDVAVKMLSDTGDIPRTQRNDLKREARKLRAVCDHPFVLKLIGVVMETNNYSLVLEYMHFGTSISFIKNYIVHVPIRVQFAYQIISAMAWLHSRSPPMKHLDLKAENVLINNNLTAKISDFGLSEWKTVTMTFSKTQPLSAGPRCGTLSHIPPEVFRDINKKGAMEEDVYAFAITLWEIFSGLVPYANCGDKDELIRNAVLNNQRPDLNALVKDSPREIKDMIQLSWDHNPAFRPTFKDLEKKIEPLFNSVQNKLPEYFKYIRTQIEAFWQEDPESTDHYECTMHWSRNGYELCNGQESEDGESLDAKPSTHNGSLNIELDTERGELEEQDGSMNASVKKEIEQDTKQTNGVDDEEVKFPPTLQANGYEKTSQNNSETLVQTLPNSGGNVRAQVNTQAGYAAVRPRLQAMGRPTQIPNGKSVQYEGEALRNNTLAQVPIYETNQVGINPFQCTNNEPQQAEVGLSGFVSVMNKQYTPGAMLSHPHGPIAQPESTVIQNEPVANGNSEGRAGEEGDDDGDTLFKGDTGLEELLSNLSVSNPGLYETILKSPDALANLSKISNGGQFTVETRQSETVQRPANSCTREVTQTGGTQLLTQVSVDQLSGQNPNSEMQARSQKSASQQQQQQQHQQQTAYSGAEANSFRMHPAPDTVSNSARKPTNPQWPVVTTAAVSTPQSHAFVTPAVQLSQQKLPRQPVRPFQSQQKQIFGQPTAQAVPNSQIPAVRQSNPPFQHPRVGDGSQQTLTGTGSGQRLIAPDQRQVIFGQPAQQTGGVQGQTSNREAPFVPVGPSESVSRQNGAASQQNVASRRPVSPVESRDQIRPGETYNRSTQQSPNQANTGGLDANPDVNTSGSSQKQPFTIYHKHAGGGITTIQMDPDHELPPNLQIGNKNVMVVNDSGNRKKNDKKKKQKCQKTQLTTSTNALSMDHIDMVAVEIGKDWKRLCRQLDMTEADIEQLQFDYYSSGLYEIMYQGIQRWIQRNGRAANVRLMAEALWEIDRDDIALRLH